MSEAEVAAPLTSDDVLLAEEAAAILRIPPSTLASWRNRRRKDGTRPGPKFVRIEGGRVRYLRSDLMEYLRDGERAGFVPDGARRA
jgi:helix-turn-helix protein